MPGSCNRTSLNPKKGTETVLSFILWCTILVIFGYTNIILKNYLFTRDIGYNILIFTNPQTWLCLNHRNKYFILNTAIKKPQLSSAGVPSYNLGYEHHNFHHL